MPNSETRGNDEMNIEHSLGRQRHMLDGVA